jgi:hypothetical protein
VRRGRKIFKVKRIFFYMSYPGLNNNYVFIQIFLFVLSILMIVFSKKISKKRASEIRGVGIGLLILDVLFLIFTLFIEVY